MKADFVGLATVGSGIALLAWLVPNGDVSPRTWFFALPTLAAGAWFWWHHPLAPASPKGWLKCLGQVVLIACLLIPTHAVIYGTQRQYLVFDFSLLALGLVIVVAGLARSIAKGEQDEV